MMLDDYAIKNSGFETEDDAIRAMIYDMELECIRYVADYYAEQGEVWYPWDG